MGLNRFCQGGRSWSQQTKLFAIVKEGGKEKIWSYTQRERQPEEKLEGERQHEQGKATNRAELPLLESALSLRKGLATCGFTNGGGRSHSLPALEGGEPGGGGRFRRKWKNTGVLGGSSRSIARLVLEPSPKSSKKRSRDYKRKKLLGKGKCWTTE